MGPWRKNPAERGIRRGMAVDRVGRPGCCRSKWSSIFCTTPRGFWPTGKQGRGKKRQQQFVVAGEGIPMRIRSTAAAQRRSGTLDDVLRGAVMLDEIEVRRGDGTQRDAQIAHDGAPVEIDAARVHFLHERAEEAKVDKRGGAESRAVSVRVHVGDVRADSEMDGDGNAEAIGVPENAGASVEWLERARGEELACGFSIADAGACRGCGDLIEIFAGFASHAELAGAEPGFDVFGGAAGERDFEVMDEGGAVHGNTGDEAAAHEFHENGADAGLDDVTADAPENGFALFFCLVNCGGDGAEIARGKNVRE